jgi:hypothetical protein
MSDSRKVFVEGNSHKAVHTVTCKRINFFDDTVSRMVHKVELLLSEKHARHLCSNTKTAISEVERDAQAQKLEDDLITQLKTPKPQ